MNESKEDYLKILYDEGGTETIVANKIIAQKLGVAPSSVSEMLVKLSKQGLVQYEPYKGSYLTEAGLEACIDIVRSHRLWEVFLMRHLGYSWREAHEDAHILEHVDIPRLVDRLDKFLNYPQTCPHGSDIPHKGEHISNSILVTLSSLSVGDKAVISKIKEDTDLLDYLEKAGLKIGMDIKVISVDDYEGPITFIQEGKRISVSFKASQMIFVKPK